MSERRINIEELAVKYGIMKGYTIHSNPKLAEENFNKFLKEFGKQLLELAAENAENEIEYDMEGNFICYGTVNKQSILDTIKQVE